MIKVYFTAGSTFGDNPNYNEFCDPIDSLYLPSAEYAYNPSLLSLTKQMPFELDRGYESPLPLDVIADLQQLHADETAKTLQGGEFVE